MLVDTILPTWPPAMPTMSWLFQVPLDHTAGIRLLVNANGDLCVSVNRGQAVFVGEGVQNA